MIGMSGIDIAPRAARADRLGNQRDRPGRTAFRRPPKLISLSEITGMEGEVITMQEIFRFRQTGRSERPA